MIDQEIREWFRDRGENTTTRQEAERIHPEDFAEFAASSGLLSRSLVPSTMSDDSATEGWSPTLVADVSAALASHGFTEWLMWHVSSLSALPVWMSDNVAVQQTYRDGFAAGAFGAFGMSERVAGADWRNTQSVIRPSKSGFVAHAQKDYSGNAQSSELVTTFARLVEGDHSSYAFFRADSRRRGYLVERNVVPEQMYVSQFRLDGYTFGADDLISSGNQAFADAVNTINVGKFNLATAAVAMGQRALSETHEHVNSRTVFGRTVGDFGQIRRGLNDAAIRLTALRAFNTAAVTSLERASETDNSHRLMTSVAKSLVTYQTVQVIRDLGEAISAKAFESESLFRIMAQYSEWLPRLEGTRYVNMMQSIRAAQSFFGYLREPHDAVTDATTSGPSYLLTRRPLGGLENTSFAHLDVDLLTTNQAELVSFRRLVEALASLFDPAPPRAPGNEAAIEALGEIFTRCYCGLVALQQLLEEGKDEEILGRVARSLTDDLVVTALWARRAVPFPNQVMRVISDISEGSMTPDSPELLHVVADICSAFAN